jgi:hypothetical protein
VSFAGSYVQRQLEVVQEPISFWVVPQELDTVKDACKELMVPELMLEVVEVEEPMRVSLVLNYWSSLLRPPVLKAIAVFLVEEPADLPWINFWDPEEKSDLVQLEEEAAVGFHETQLVGKRMD